MTSLRPDEIKRRLLAAGVAVGHHLNDRFRAQLAVAALGPDTLGNRCRAALFYSRIHPTWKCIDDRTPVAPLAGRLDIDDPDRLSKAVHRNRCLKEGEMQAMAQLCNVAIDWLLTGKPRHSPAWMGEYLKLSHAHSVLAAAYTGAFDAKDMRSLQAFALKHVESDSQKIFISLTGCRSPWCGVQFHTCRGFTCLGPLMKTNTPCPAWSMWRCPVMSGAMSSWR